MNTYDRGDRIRLGNHTGDTSRIAFTTAAGVVADPTACTLTIRPPGGTRLVYAWPTAGESGALVREELGRFYVDLTLDVAGTWTWRLAGTGAVVTAEESSFVVRTSTVL